MFFAICMISYSFKIAIYWKFKFYCAFSDSLATLDGQ